MGRIFFAAVCTILLFCTVTYATPLQIQSGGISVSGLLTDSFFDFSGPGFSITGMNFANAYFAAPTYHTVFDFQPGGTRPVQVTVDGYAPCIPQDFFDHCGYVHFSSITLPALHSNYTEMATFTASGHLNVGPGFDIVGYGFVTVCLSAAGCPNTTFVPDAQFTFIAPEPHTLALLSLGIIAIPVVSRRQRRAAKAAFASLLKKP